MDNSRFIGNDTGEELLTPLSRQLNFWFECSISVVAGMAIAWLINLQSWENVRLVNSILSLL